MFIRFVCPLLLQLVSALDEVLASDADNDEGEDDATCSACCDMATRMR